MESIVINKECKDIKIQYITLSLKKYIVSVICMSIPIVIIKLVIDNYILVIIISIIISSFTYAFSCILLKDDIALSSLEQLKQKFIKN